LTIYGEHSLIIMFAPDVSDLIHAVRRCYCTAAALLLLFTFLLFTLF